MTGAEHDTDPRVLSVAARALVGAGSVLFGLYLGGMNATADETEWNVAVFCAVVIIGGTVMIAQARQQPRIGRAGRIAGTAVGVGGLLAGLVAPVQQTCCDAAWTVSVGLPLPWTTGHGDTWSQAVGEAWRGSWDPVSAIANTIFWGYAGLIVAVLVGLVRRARATRPVATT